MIPSLASAQIKKVSGGAYLMRLKYTKGQVSHMELTTAITGMPPGQGGATADGKMTAIMQTHSTVQTVTNGNATMLVSVGPMTLNGKTVVQETKPQSVTVDPQGRPVGGAGGQSQGFGTRMPDKAVKVGESWSAPLPMGHGTMGGGSGGTATYTFKGVKKVDGKQVAVVNMSVKNPQIKSGSGTLYLMTSDGAIYKASLVLNTVNPQSGAPMSMTVTIRRK